MNIFGYYISEFSLGIAFLCPRSSSSWSSCAGYDPSNGDWTVTACEAGKGARNFKLPG